MRSPRFQSGILRVAFVLCAFFLVPHSGGAALTDEEQLSIMLEQCSTQIYEEMQEERNVYRDVQYGKSMSVLGVRGVDSTDLVPYLTLNYHALSCRLRQLCDAVGASHGDKGTEHVLSHRPLGCSRLFSARGRWWSPERSEYIFKTEPIEECARG